MIRGRLHGLHLRLRFAGWARPRSGYRRPVWPLGLYRVAGESMTPSYRAGDTLVGLRWFRPRVGQVVVAHHIGRPLIKRITQLNGDGIWVKGDNAAASTDSRHFGQLERAQLEARIILKLG